MPQLLSCFSRPLLLLLLLAGCAQHTGPVSPGFSYAYRPQTLPAWLNTEPEAVAGELRFVRISRTMPSEQLARSDAKTAATASACSYLTTLVAGRFESALGPRFTFAREEPAVWAGVVEGEKKRFLRELAGIYGRERGVTVLERYLETSTDAAGASAYRYMQLERIPLPLAEDVSRRAVNALLQGAKEESATDKAVAGAWRQLLEVGVTVDTGGN